MSKKLSIQESVNFYNPSPARKQLFHLMRCNDIPIHGRGGMFNKFFLPKGILQDGILLGDIEILGF